MTKTKSISQEALREFGLPIGIFVFILVASLVFLIPKIKQGLELRRKIVQQNEQINKLSQKLADLRTLSEAELFDSANLLLTALPQEKDFYGTLIMTKQILNRNNILMDSFKFSPGEISEEEEAKKSDISPLAVDVSFIATFESFKRMLAEVDSIMPLVKIEGLRVGSLEEPEATESASLFGFSGSMKIVSYFSPLPKTLGKAESLLPKISNQDRELIEKLKSFQQYQAESVSEELPSSVIGRDNPFSI